MAEPAGVGRVTLYAHFPSREAVLEAVLERTISQAGVIIEERRPEEGPADEALRRLLRAAAEDGNGARPAGPISLRLDA